MNVRLTYLGVALALISVVADAGKEDDAAIPVAPIATSDYLGWTNALNLHNDDLTVVLVPETGRIAFIGVDPSANLLRVDSALEGKTALADAPDFWFNFGGDWLWPTAQNRWADFQESDWPPSRLLDGRSWEARGWKSADGSQCGQLTQTYGEPLHVTVTRFVKVPKEGTSFEVRQKIQRTANSSVPVTLWTISQIAGAEYVVIPTDEDSSFDGGLASLRFEMPGKEFLHRCDGTALYHVLEKGEHKLGSDSARSWVAAVRGDTLIVEQTTPHEEDSTYPEGGCTVQVYANAGLGYAEIETMSPEKVLAPDEAMENILRVTCYTIPPGLDGCDLADKVRELIGELGPATDRP